MDVIEGPSQGLCGDRLPCPAPGLARTDTFFPERGFHGSDDIKPGSDSPRRFDMIG